MIYIINIRSVCLCRRLHAIGDRRYFLAPCDNRPPARPARIPLGDTLCGYRTASTIKYYLLITYSRFPAPCRPSCALCSITQTDAASHNRAKRHCGL